MNAETLEDKGRYTGSSDEWNSVKRDEKTQTGRIQSEGGIVSDWVLHTKRRRKRHTAADTRRASEQKGRPGAGRSKGGWGQWVSLSPGRVEQRGGEEKRFNHLKLILTCCSEAPGSSAMDGVMEGALVLCACKLLVSLPFLSSLATSNSPVSFCCCLLLIFTDVLVTVFLGLLCLFEPWLPELTPRRDVIVLRFLLFLGHTYGAVLLLTTPLIAVETLSRLLLQPGAAVTCRAADQTVCSHVRWDFSDEESAKTGKEERTDRQEDSWLSPAVGYLCCLSVWVVVALTVSCPWMLEEVRAAACMRSTNSLIRCLPSMSSPMPSTDMNPFWGMAFLSFLLLDLVSSSRLRKWCPERTVRQKHGVNSNGHRRDLVVSALAPSRPASDGTSVSASVRHVDPQTTESSCTVHTASSRSSMQMWVRCHGDSVLLSHECLSVEKGGPGPGLEAHMNSPYRSPCVWQQWGFPSLGVNVMTGFMAALSIFVLPLYVTVNILLIRSVERLLELCITPLVSQRPNTLIPSSASTSGLV
ncbi:unnamed protein product [Lampetra planeri]